MFQQLLFIFWGRVWERKTLIRVGMGSQANLNDTSLRYIPMTLTDGVSVTAPRLKRGSVRCASAPPRTGIVSTRGVGDHP